LTVAACRIYSPAAMVALRIVFLLIATIVVSRCALLAMEPSVEIGPRQAVILLANGEVLQGKVSRAGDHYFVWVPGGEIRLPVKRVQRLCDTLDDAYVYLSQSGPGSVEGHLELTTWCLRHNLFGYAANELRAAMTLEPSDPRVAVLARRLKLARERAAVESADNIPVATKKTDDSVDERETESTPMQLPEGAVAAFTSKLQPLLINKCAGAGCHGSPTESTFRLSRMLGGRKPTRRQTVQNLVEVLRWINMEQPGNSPLLQKPLQPSHGGMAEPIFTDADRSQYKRLVEFVNLAAKKPTPVQEDEQPGSQLDASQANAFPSEMQRLQRSGDNTLGQTSPADVQNMRTIDRPLSNNLADPVTEPSGLVDAQPSPGAGVSEDEVLLEAFESNPIQRGTIVERFVPIDAFDPAIFNRRYFRAEKSRGPSQDIPKAQPEN